MFAVLSSFILSFVYKVYIGFLSRMRDWTVAVAQHNTTQHNTTQHNTTQHSTAQYMQYICLLKYSVFENMAV
jgi:hypothetical protein